jgi:hypothetical protein
MALTAAETGRINIQNVTLCVWQLLYVQIARCNIHKQTPQRKLAVMRASHLAIHDMHANQTASNHDKVIAKVMVHRAPSTVSGAKRAAHQAC